MSKIFKAFLVLLAIFVAVLGILGGYQTSQKFKYPVAYADYIVKYSKANDLDPFLVMAVIKVESNFVPEAHSGVAGGLMQLTEETAEWNAKELGITTEYDYMDPETNIRFGCHYLRHLIDVYGNIDTALAAYNGGMGNVYLNIFYHSLFFLRRMKMKRSTMSKILVFILVLCMILPLISYFAFGG